MPALSEFFLTPSKKSPNLVGLSEIAERFGISRQLALTWARRVDFPAPVAELSVGRVWELSAVLDWAKTWEPARKRL